MADENIVVSGVQFEARDFAEFQRSMRRANNLIDDLNDNLDMLGDSFSGINRKAKTIDFSSARRSVRSFSVSSRRDLLGIASDITIVTRGLFDLGEQLIRLPESLTTFTREFESAFVGVAKTVDDLVVVGDDGFIQLTDQGEKFKDTLTDLSFEIPKTFRELAGIAELAGQYGLDDLTDDADEAQEVLEAFTRTVAGLTVATELQADNAGRFLAQITNIYQDSTEDISGTIDDLGNVIVELGNTSATTEGKIVTIAERIAAAGNISGLAIEEVLALGTAISSLGVTSEAGGTAASRALLLLNESLTGTGEVVADNTEEISDLEQKILSLNGKLVQLEAQTGVTGESLLDQFNAFVEGGGAIEDFGRLLGDTRRRSLFTTQQSIEELTEELNKLRAEQGQVITTTDEVLRAFAEAADLPVEEFRDLAEIDPAEALTLFVEGLARIDAEGGNVTAILDKIGLGSSEAQRTFLGLAGAGDLLRRTFARANAEMEDGNALIEETELRYATLDARFEIFRNILKATADDLTTDFIPALGMLLEESGEVALVLGDRLPQVFDALIDKIREVNDATDLIDLDFDFDVSGNLADFLDNVIEGIQNFDTQPVIDALNFLDEVGDMTPLEALNTALSNLTGYTVSDFSGIAEFISIIGQAGGERIQSLIDFIEGLTDFVVGVATADAELQQAGITTTITSLVEGILTPLQTLSEGLLGFDLRQALIDLFGGADTVVGQLLSNVEGAAEDFAIKLPPIDLSSLEFTGIPEFPEELSVITDFLSGFDPLVEDTIPDLIDAVVGLAQTLSGEAGQNIIQFVSDLVLSVAGFTVDNAEAIGSFLSTLSQISISPLISTLETIDGLVQVLGGLVAMDTQMQQSGLLKLGEAIEGSLIRPLDALLNFADDLTEADLRGTLEEELGDIEIPEGLIISTGNLGEALGTLAESLSALTGLELKLFGEDLSELLGIMAGEDIGDTVQNLVNVFGAIATVKIENFARMIDLLAGFVDLLRIWRDESEEVDFSFVADLLSRLSGAMTSELASAEVDTDMQAALGQWLARQFEFDEESTGIQLAQIIGSVISTAMESLESEDLGIQFNFFKLLVPGFGAADTASEEIDTLAANISSLLQQVINKIAVDPVGIFTELGQSFVDSFTGILDGVDLGLPTMPRLFEFLATVPKGIAEAFQGILNEVSFGFPTVSGMLDPLEAEFDRVVEAIKSKLAEIDILGFQPFAADDVDTSALDQAVTDAEQAGEDTGEGFAEGIKNKLTEATDAALETLGEGPLGALVDWLEAESPSQLYARVGAEIPAGLAMGILSSSAVDDALKSLQESLMQFIERITVGAVPGVDRLNLTLDALSTQEIPELAGAITQQIIPNLETWIELNTLLADGILIVVVPALMEMMFSTLQLDSAIIQLASSTEFLSSIMTGLLAPALERISDLQDTAKERGEDLKDVIEDLVTQYENLAEAIEKVNEAGTGVPTSTTPAPGSGSVPFQTGGAFQVPSTIPRSLRGPTGGMLLEVHPNELVQVLSASVSKSLQKLPESLTSMRQSLKVPQISGAPISNMTSTTNSSEVRNEFNLNIREAPSRDIRDSFDLFRSLGGAVYG